jgi:hypothetical protein
MLESDVQLRPSRLLFESLFADTAIPRCRVDVDCFGGGLFTLLCLFTSFFGFSGDGLMKETRFADVDIPLTVYWRSLLFPPFQGWLVWAGLC